MVIPVKIGTSVCKAEMWGDKLRKVNITHIIFPFMAQSLFYWEGWKSDIG